MIKTKICDLLGITYPIIQGGMAWVSDASLASAVSNVGGLGIISAMNADASYLRSEIRKCRAMTNNIFGVNIMLMSPFADEVAQVVIEEDIKIVTTGAGMPTKYIQSWLDAGIKVIPVVASVAIAQRCERMGATAIIAEGGEAGGHVGELNTYALLPQVVDAVSVPVIAAGGICDGRGVAAALLLGAEGVQCGTCFLVASECTIHQNYKQQIIKAGDTDTIVTGRRFGHPVRSLKSKFTRKFAEMEKNPNVPDSDILDFGSGALRKAVKEGNIGEGCFMAGQSAGLVKKEGTTKEIIEDMFTQCEQLLLSANKFSTNK